MIDEIAGNLRDIYGVGPMMRRISMVPAIVVAVLSVGACGNESQPNPPGAPTATSAAEGSSTLEITCLRDGTQLHTPVVEARSDGVHVRVDNHAGEGVSINGLGWDFDQGISEAVLSTPPGTLQIACWPYSDHDGRKPDSVTLKIVDPDDHWAPTELQCGDGMISQSISDFAAGSSGRKGDPVEIVRSELRGLKRGDVVERGAYPDQDEPIVRIVRSDRVIGVASLSRTDDGGYLFGGFSSCADARLGQR